MGTQSTWGVKKMMARLQVLLLSLLAAIVVGSPAPQHYGIKSAIVGGQEAEPHQFPWQISLKYLDIWPHHYHTCGATIVDSTHIVCAAHCISGRQKSWFQVVAGAHNIHTILPEYAQPLPMAPKGDDPAGGTICVNSGWGSTSHSSAAQMPNKLQFVEMPIVSRPDCQEDYSGVNGVNEGMICAGIDEGGISACSGDSGTLCLP